MYDIQCFIFLVKEGGAGLTMTVFQPTSWVRLSKILYEPFRNEHFYPNMLRVTIPAKELSYFTTYNGVFR